MKSTILLVGTVLVVLGVGGFLWLSAHIGSYDQRYEDCMTVKQARLYPANHYFPDNAYDQAMRECENIAGLPPTQTGNPDSWRAS